MAHKQKMSWHKHAHIRRTCIDWTQGAVEWHAKGGSPMVSQPQVSISEGGIQQKKCVLNDNYGGHPNQGIGPRHHQSFACHCECDLTY